KAEKQKENPVRGGIMGGVNIHEECLSWPTCRFENKKLQFNAVHYATPPGFASIFDTSPGVAWLRHSTTGLPYTAPRRGNRTV
ncbi:MAG: hypothetical protein IJA63_10340, partial [Akkermansia sp.]|nr:hypothetical protein [Akkermansia sp.]